MKKLVQFFILLMILIIPSGVSALYLNIEDKDIYNADTQYYKIVDGVLVNEGVEKENYNVYFDKDNNKLYLNNFISDNAIVTDINGLNIILEGESTIDTDDLNGIESKNDILFSGTGSLNIVADGNGIRGFKKVFINSGVITTHGNNYNGIESYQIEVNGGVIKTSGAYDGIHTMPDYESQEFMDDKFILNGGNIYIKGNINSGNKELNNGIVIFTNDNIEYEVYGDATILSDMKLENSLVLGNGKSLTVGQGATLIIPENIEVTLINKEQLKIDGSIKLEGDIKVDNKKFYNIYILETENGIVSYKQNIALEGEEVILNIVPDSNYGIDSLKYEYNKTEAVIENNKFIMPNHDVTIKASFKKIFTFENPDTIDNVSIFYSMFIISVISLLVVGFYVKKQGKLN